ncbi:TonB-dependent receptor [Sphingorhabdus lutea]|uniref:TonB-dependent receptor n=1 Tax=Sphingorhabdus lutea TaxID=1913578 RepID=A0A1L3JA11_9SPHN|nr:TonB-dependent receptor [Sphingorhabdus lutea]APG61976.1 TonB-dependent receptor [Sphingorhabdus lutea]
MRKIQLFTTLLLATSSLCAKPALAYDNSPANADLPEQPSEDAPAATVEEAPVTTGADAPETSDAEVEISSPGGDDYGGEIVVRGKYIPDPIRATPEVVSVLSAEDIAKTGEGDIAGALQRVTGLSVVGGRFVYVRGLGERYSLALLNGSALPSPEPLRRVVPLDLFPTSILASTVVQKSYSANYPGEFGGGVINLTTRSAPDEPFFDLGVSISGDSITTGDLGYTYFGSRTDFLGYDNGARALPRPLANAIATGNRVTEGADFSADDIRSITASLSNANTNVIQRNSQMPANWSGDMAAGKSFDLGSAELGLVAVAGISNSWRTRSGLQQLGAQQGDILVASQDFKFVSTENRVVVNGMVNAGLSFDEHKLRLTSIYIHDNLKEARVGSGNNFDTVSPSVSRPEDTIQTGQTSWYERQLFDVQGTGEFRFSDLAIDIRGSYAKSKRDAPYERSYSYTFDETAMDYVNNLRSPGQNARLSFSELDDKVVSGALDISYKLPTSRPVTISGGYAYYLNERSAIRRDFEFFPLGALPLEVAQQRIDYLVSDFNVYNWDLLLRETTGGFGSAAYSANLETHAGYIMAEAELLDGVNINIGARYEDGTQSVTPTALFGLPPLAATSLSNDYWLPAATITWNFADDMQLRLAASKTIARPQFRELAPQPYRDTESSRTFFGNQFLEDSELINAEARYEWYFASGQRFTLAGFFKDIEKPIEATAVQVGSTFLTSFANAPRAQLWGAEVEVEKYIPLYNLSTEGGFFSNRRVAIVANYTYTDSKIIIKPGDTVISFTTAPNAVAADIVFDSTRRLRLTGQSKHLANLQFSLENEDRLSQQSILLTYSSERATNRGPNLTPDFIERPGLRLDVILREAMKIGKQEFEMKFELRNLTGTNYSETQSLGTSTLQINSYDIGTSASLGVTFKY